MRSLRIDPYPCTWITGVYRDRTKDQERVERCEAPSLVRYYLAGDEHNSRPFCPGHGVQAISSGWRVSDG